MAHVEPAHCGRVRLHHFSSLLSLSLYCVGYLDDDDDEKKTCEKSSRKSLDGDGILARKAQLLLCCGVTKCAATARTNSGLVKQLGMTCRRLLLLLLLLLLSSVRAEFISTATVSEISSVDGDSFDDDDITRRCFQQISVSAISRKTCAVPANRSRDQSSR